MPSRGAGVRSFFVRPLHAPRAFFRFLLNDGDQGEGGQVIAYLSFFLFLTLLFIVMVMNAGSQVNKKMEMQNAADASVFSGATWACRGLNLISLSNVTMTQIISLIICLDALGDTADICKALAESQQAVGEATAEFSGAILIPPAILAKIVCEFVSGLDSVIEQIIEVLWKVQEILEKVEFAIMWATPFLGEISAFHIASANGASLGFCLPVPLLALDVPMIGNELVEEGEFGDLAKPVHEGDDSGLGGFGIPEDDAGKQAVPEMGLNIPVASFLTYVKRGGAPLQQCRLIFQASFGLLTVFGTWLASPLVYHLMTEVKYYEVFGMEMSADLADQLENSTYDRVETDPYKVKEWLGSEEARERDGIKEIGEIKWHYVHAKSRSPDLQPPEPPNTVILTDEDQYGMHDGYLSWDRGERRITQEDLIVENAQDLKNKMNQAGFESTARGTSDAESIHAYTFVDTWDEQVLEDAQLELPPRFDADGNPIPWTVYHREEASFLGAEIKVRLLTEDQVEEAQQETSGGDGEGGGGGDEHGKPYMLVDDWKEKVDYVGVAWLTPARSKARDLKKTFHDSYTDNFGILTFAQAKIYNPTRADTFTQDWRPKLVRFSKHEELMEWAGSGMVSGVSGYLPEGGAGGLGDTVDRAAKAAEDFLKHIMTH